ncbi:MAG: Na(+)-translocating NADH-quinone reductase subunit A [Bacteroidales bacterium]|nr:Na(+)-translocating NADH-quinone reductase subunit A [Bacteroidales bacterium]
MSNNIRLKGGLDIPISGEAARKTVASIKPDVVAIQPDDFKGLVPRLLVREGDKVLAGSPVLADKQRPDILVTSPVSGTVQQVVRGDKRKLLAVLVKADDQQESVDFGTAKVSSLSEEDVRKKLLSSGLWIALVQRPFGVIADPAAKPKAIFVSAFDTAPLAANPEYTLGDRMEDIQAGVDALGKLTPGGVHVCLNEANYSGTPFHRIEHAVLHTFSGKHPAGNVGVQISHISPIGKGDIVWTVSLTLLAAIGRLFVSGKLSLVRKVAVTGPVAKDPAYVETVPGMAIRQLGAFYDNSAKDIRFVSGNPLSGRNVGEDGFLGFFDNQVTLLHEGTERELFGWIKPFRFNQFSSSMTYFSWLLPKKKYSMDTNTHGGPRAFVVSDVYGKVLPMDIFPIYLVKACLAGDIEKMEKYGIYEVLPEDLALCEFVDPSKNDIQAIIQNGIDRMIKEMA